MTRAIRAPLLVAVVLLGLIPGALLAAPDLALSMAVDVPIPGPGQPVQFTITLSNIGTDSATGVTVTDKLPAELAIPAGMAAFTSTGTYDPATGIWTVGDLAAGNASALLVIPAIVAVATQPPCSANIATTTNSLDTQTANNRAVAVVRRSASDRCVDLAVSGSGSLLPTCATARHLELSVVVTNAGPDAASDVLVDISQTATILPALRFANSGCSGTRCAIASLAAGSSVTLQAVSDDFQNTTSQTLTLEFDVSSSETDYATSNNQTSASGPVPVFDTCEVNVGNGGGGGGGCFIATAAYGSPLEPHVMALRQFRDRVLTHFGLGRAFIRAYYRYSPPLAAVIAAHPSLRSLTRALLTPLVLSIVYPLRAAVVLGLSILLLTAWRYRPRRT